MLPGRLSGRHFKRRWRDQSSDAVARAVSGRRPGRCPDPNRLADPHSDPHHLSDAGTSTDCDAPINVDAFSHRYCDADTDATADPDASAVANRHRHAVTHADANRNRHTVTLADANRHRHAAAVADRHAHRDASSNTDQHRDPGPFADEHARPTSYRFSDAGCNGHSLSDAIADGHARAGRPAVAVHHGQLDRRGAGDRGRRALHRLTRWPPVRA